MKWGEVLPADNVLGYKTWIEARTIGSACGALALLIALYVIFHEVGEPRFV